MSNGSYKKILSALLRFDGKQLYPNCIQTIERLAKFAKIEAKLFWKVTSAFENFSSILRCLEERESVYYLKELLGDQAHSINVVAHEAG